MCIHKALLSALQHGLHCLLACIVVDVHSLFVVPKLGVVFALHEKHAIHGMCHTQAIIIIIIVTDLESHTRCASRAHVVRLYVP
jgi:hypothetical protein